MTWYSKRTKVTGEPLEDHAHALETEIADLHEELTQRNRLAMKPDQVLQNIAEGEGQSIEFKEGFAEQNAAIEALCAFSNAGGGTVLFGVKDNGDIVGLRRDMGKKTIEDFANRIKANTDPPMTPMVEKVEVRGATVYYASVAAHRQGELFFAFKKPMIRVGTTNQVMNPDQMRRRLLEAANPLAEEQTVRREAQERIPHIAVMPRSMRPDFGGGEHLMWAEMAVTNTSPSLTMQGVRVRVTKRIRLMQQSNQKGGYVPGGYTLMDYEDWTPVTVLWSNRDSEAPHRTVDIAPASARTVIVAFCDDSNGGHPVFNSEPSHGDFQLDGAYIELEVTSSNAATWKAEFYLHCHPPYVTDWSGANPTDARFQFESWESWSASRKVTRLVLGPDTESSQH